jgi:hypothetical protein
LALHNNEFKTHPERSSVPQRKKELITNTMLGWGSIVIVILLDYKLKNSFCVQFFLFLSGSIYLGAIVLIPPILFGVWGNFPFGFILI